MKAWTDEECAALVAKIDGVGEFGFETAMVHALIRAAVAEARREEREACAEVAAGFVTKDPQGSIDTGRMWMSGTATRIAAAIRARGDKEPRDAER